MPLEIEVKFAADPLPSLLHRLSERGVTLDSGQRQRDSYFGHPVRDFAVTDEALRLRQTAGECELTYKGPKLDLHSKTREELQIPISTEDYDTARKMLISLGFRLVADVVKLRRTGQLAYDGLRVTIAVDEVEQVGNFVELEVMAEGDGFDSIRDRLLALAAELQLTQPERRSYLELLIGDERERFP